MRSLHLNDNLSKQAIIAQVIQEMPAELVFTKSEMDELYHLSVGCKNNYLSQEELITKISHLRGGALVDVAAALGLISVMIILLMNGESLAFQPNPHVNVPPHLQWLYGNHYKPGQFGYKKGAGPRSIQVAGMTQNAGSEKKGPSSGSYSYIDVMKKLEKQSSKNISEIEVGDQIYSLKNPDHMKADELKYLLAEKMYDSIRERDTDICDIAENIGFKADTIKNVKDHVFYQKHKLDTYACLGEASEYKRFDPSLPQALAWKRLETGTHTQDDVTWIKHECAERHYELKYNSGYKKAHESAQKHFDGDPWKNNF